MVIRSRNELYDSGLEIDLTGPQGNAFYLLGLAETLAKRMPDKNYQKIHKEMISGDYEHLLSTFDREFGKFVTLYR